MRSLIHPGRRRVVILSLVTLLSLAGLLRAINYNNTLRTAGEMALQHSNKVIQDIEVLWATIAGAEASVQSFLLSGDPEWKKELSTANDRMLLILNEISTLEPDAMQQQKFGLIKSAIEQKISFQQNILNIDTLSASAPGAMNYFATNRILSSKIQLPLSLVSERQSLLLNRRSSANESAATHIRFVTIFSAVFLYLLILCALWHLRQRPQSGQAIRLNGDDEPSIKELSSDLPERFIGVFPINRKVKATAYHGEPAIIRILWSKDELHGSGSYASVSGVEELQVSGKTGSSSAGNVLLAAEDLVPEWIAAGLPEELSLHADRGSDHYLGQAVNANYYHPGPLYNRSSNSYMPGSGVTAYRVLPGTAPASQEAGRQPGHDSPRFEISALVSDVLKPFYSEAEEKNIRLLQTIDPSIPSFLSGDATKLSGILHNIVENAIRFTYKGYIQVTITAMNIQAEQAEIAFSIADTGKGLDADQMHDLLHGPGAIVPALYRAKKMAESQQSQLMIHSTEEDGTVCCFIAKFSC